jgi:hypothetical protein
MLGWILVFMMLSLTSVLAGSVRGMGFTPSTTAGVVFGCLLLLSLLTRVIRGRA